jgi:LysR family transcriptional activator of nhaA
VRLICQEDRLESLLADLAIHRLDMVLADRPMPPGTVIKGYSHPLGDSGVAFMAAPELAARLTGGFPDCLDGAPLLLPGRDSALHGVPCRAGWNGRGSVCVSSANSTTAP